MPPKAPLIVPLGRHGGSLSPPPLTAGIDEDTNCDGARAAAAVTATGDPYAAKAVPTGYRGALAVTITTRPLAPGIG